jgi:hypothetical protein
MLGPDIKKRCARTLHGTYDGYFVPSDVFMQLIKYASDRVPLDEEWYVSRYDDVKVAIERKQFKSAREHYAFDGFLEGRQPFSISVDEKFYLKKYPDVAKGVRGGSFESAQHHYDALGFVEGRLPYADFDLSRHRR